MEKTNKQLDKVFCIFRSCCTHTHTHIHTAQTHVCIYTCHIQAARQMLAAIKRIADEIHQTNSAATSHAHFLCMQSVLFSCTFH